MNKVILLGRMAKDPELRSTQSEKAVATFTVACDRIFAKGEADFINCVAWNKTAEFVNRYFKKGDRISLCGRIQVRSWEDNGQKRYATEVVADEVEFAQSKSEGMQSPTPQPQIETTGNFGNIPAMIDDFVPIDDSDLPF